MTSTLQCAANILHIAVICTFIADISGFPQTVRKILSRWLNVRIDTLKPLDCSLCLTWWTGLTYLILNEITIKNIAILSITCALTPVISELILALRDTAIKLIRYIQ